MIKNATIIPTGDEIAEGIVADTNSPAIMGIILESFPECEVTRLKPCRDVEKDIIATIDQCVMDNSNLIIIIGGSGGGHRYVSTLSKDYTHSALIKYLPDSVYKEIYGLNGHLWSKLIVGEKNNSFIMNVPGPYVEAVAATKACIQLLEKDIKTDKKKIVENIADAVFKQYPSGGH